MPHYDDDQPTLWDDVYKAVEVLLQQDGDDFTIKELDQELVNEEEIERLAKRVRTRPALVVAVGDPTANDQDSTHEVSKESLPIEVIVAVSNLRSQRAQLNQARRIAQKVRALIQGEGFSSANTSKAVFTFENTEHLGTSRDLTLYSVMFRVEYSTAFTP